ncbi:Oidioi.mRNA.OKI2018_I69.PAR.g12827.t1.cds [Oikopleura dioica]|uniref:Oidioi.mRNA.OKI2018_I69.PAR.g12827.t1.cds n=1 Tax=Oikopleura dioica TaxID=34765 RepID=A0ABN7S529_OIKDI|nr:Oidioi.mRNA.OKI2018_I69.PAR.g12827.t1.cds [Oikopleura dioica]
MQTKSFHKSTCESDSEELLLSEADKKKSEEDQSSTANKIEKISPAQQIAENECQPEPSELSSIDPDDTLNAVFSQAQNILNENANGSEYNWKLNRLLNDSPGGRFDDESRIGSVLDGLSQVQSDLVNIDDSVSQVASREQSRPAKQATPRVLNELQSNFTADTGALLAINPESIVIKPPKSSIMPQSLASLNTVRTDDIAAEYKKMQQRLNNEKRLAGIPVREFDEVSIDSDLNSVQTEMVHQKFMELLRRPGGTLPTPAASGSKTSSRAVSTVRSRPVSSKPSTVRSRPSSLPRSRATSGGGRSYRVDPDIESEKVKAELNLLYVEKRKAESELRSIKTEIEEKEMSQNELESSMKMENLELSSKLSTTQRELFKTKKDYREVIEDLQLALEEMTRKYEDLREKRSTVSVSRSDAVVNLATSNKIQSLEKRIRELEVSVENESAEKRILQHKANQLEHHHQQQFSENIEAHPEVERLIISKRAEWIKEHEITINSLQNQLSGARNHNAEMRSRHQSEVDNLKSQLESERSKNSRLVATNEENLQKLEQENEISKSKERESMEKKLKKLNEVIVKMEKDNKNKDESIRQLCAKCDKLSKEPNALAKLRKYILKICPTMNVKEIDNIDSALRILETAIKSSAGDEETYKTELARKDEELRKIQKNMAQWKKNTSRKLAQKFEVELRRLSENASTMAESESGFASNVN